ncbi:MAG TPA: MalY/PatB family protein [Candidatus Acidoferrum sp.]|nr:MalY/PatB family protein [Candidatus Acidoferrum sp.]
MARTVSDAPPYTIFDDISVEELRRRRSYKWREFPSDVLPAFVAEMDFRLAPAVAKALADAVEQNDAGYALPSDELTQAFAGFAKQRFRWDLGQSNVVLIPDVMVGITEVLRTAVSPGSGVVINTPVYPPFFSHIIEAGCRVVEAPLAYGDGGYELDLDAIERAFATEAQAYLLCNPHNPTGLVLSAKQLTRIAELADRYDIVVLADEIHAPLVLAGASHTPFLSLGETATNRGLALVSASKAWNTPGLKCAQLVVPFGPMQAVVDRLPEGLSFRAGHLGVIASIAAYRDSVAWLDDLLQVLDRNRRLMGELIAEQLPGVRYHQPQGTYLAWLDCRALDLPEQPVDFFLKRGRVALGPGPKFGEQGRGHVRVTMGTSEAILREIVDRMAAAIR